MKQTLLFQQELLSEMIGREEAKSYMQRLGHLMVHLLAWVMCLATIFLGAMAIHYLSESKYKVQQLLCRHTSTISGTSEQLYCCRCYDAFSREYHRNSSEQKHLPTADFTSSFSFLADILPYFIFCLLVLDQRVLCHQYRLCFCVLLCLSICCLKKLFGSLCLSLLLTYLNLCKWDNAS